MVHPDLTNSPSRREILSAAAAATVTLPLLGTALGTPRAARGNGSLKPVAVKNPPAEKPGWFATTLKPADLKDNEFTAIAGHQIVLARTGKTVTALTNVCTHSGCSMDPKAGSKTLLCTCHDSQFNLDGSVAHSPAKQPLSHFALRVNDKGLIEIDPGQKLAKDDKGATITIG